jgi:murein DD-endopeptidase MepM/ murein hydrolase activator NlpD
MALLKIKVATYFMGGMLLCMSISGCSLSQPPDVIKSNQPPVEPTPNPTPTTLAEKLGVIAPTPTTAPAALLPLPTPLVAPMPIPTPKDGAYTYHTIGPGETLSYIALIYGVEIGDLVELNNLAGPSALIQVDQQLRVPVQTDRVAPDGLLLVDSEVVYSPAYADFNLAQFINQKNGYLASYSQFLDEQQLSGAEIIERVSIQYSIGPRLLLALLEHYGGWVTNPTPTELALSQPLGPHNPRGSDLYLALSFTANRINAAYYGYKRDGFWIFTLPNQTQAISRQGLNAGAVGLQNILAIHSDNWDTWVHELSPDGFLTTYKTLFGPPSTYESSPVIPIDLTQPPLSLPWQVDKGFYFTSGPHPAYVDGSAWAAIDFGPPDILGNCFYSDEPITAAADGVVVAARQGEVYLDLDGDGLIQTGWVLFYLHVALDLDVPVQVGQHLKQGDVIGYASCEGGLANSSHLHFARRYNGEWLAAGGPVPMNLSGWVVQPNLAPYQGTMLKGPNIREACECWDAKMNLIVNTTKE